MNRTPLTRHTPLARTAFKRTVPSDRSHGERTTAMSRRSTKRAGQEREYGVLAKAFLVEHPICQRCECNPSDQVHHIRRRAGRMLCDVRYFAALCGTCHRWVHGNVAEAKATGWLVSQFEGDEAL